MKKLADISQFERLQSNANAGFTSDLSVFNEEMSYSFKALWEAVHQSGEEEAIKIIETVWKKFGEVGADALMAAFNDYWGERTDVSYDDIDPLLSASEGIESKDCRDIYEYCMESEPGIIGAYMPYYLEIAASDAGWPNPRIADRLPYPGPAGEVGEGYGDGDSLGAVYGGDNPWGHSDADW